MRLTHPDLNVVIDVPEGSAEVLAESGWVEAPELVQANPALAPGETETVPESPKSRRKPTETES